MDRGYEEVRQYLSYLNTILSSLSPNICATIADKEAEEGIESGDIVVFNSLSWEVRNWVEMELNFKEGEVEAIKGLKSGKEEIDVEVIKFARYEDDSVKYAKIGFVPTVPAMGYKVYNILEHEPKRHPYDPNFIMIR